jgi:hypothetical protein
MAKRKKQVPRIDYDLTIYTVHDPVLMWYGVFTKRIDDQPVYEIESVGFSPNELLKCFNDAGSMVEAGIDGHQLVLPEMGDWKVRYFSPR